MKPSEFMKKINLDVVGDTSELDKKFIDREEQQKKIEELKEEICKIEGFGVPYNIPLKPVMNLIDRIFG